MQMISAALKTKSAQVSLSLVRESGYPAGYASNDGIELEQTSLRL